MGAASAESGHGLVRRHMTARTHAAIELRCRWCWHKQRSLLHLVLALLLAQPAKWSALAVAGGAADTTASAPLPMRAALRTVASAAAARRALHTVGAFALQPEALPLGLHTLTRLDTWLLLNAHTLPRYPVRQSPGRTHVLLLPEDGDGGVAAALGAMVRALGEALPLRSVLAELAAFVVEPWAP